MVPLSMPRTISNSHFSESFSNFLLNRAIEFSSNQSMAKLTQCSKGMLVFTMWCRYKCRRYSRSIRCFSRKSQRTSCLEDSLSHSNPNLIGTFIC